MFAEMNDFISACTDPYFVIISVFIAGFVIGQIFSFIGALVEEAYYWFVQRKRKRHEKKVFGDDHA